MLTNQDVENFYNQFAGKLTNYLVANRVDYSLACDIVQEAFLRVWNKRATLTAHTSISGLLYTIVRNLHVDYIRKNRCVIFGDEINEDDEAEEEPSREDSLLLLRRMLQEAFATLPETLRKSYILFQVSNYSIKEIAEMTGASENLTKVRIHRAKEKLQKKLIRLKDFEELL